MTHGEQDLSALQHQFSRLAAIIDAHGRFHVEITGIFDRALIGSMNRLGLHRAVEQSRTVRSSGPSRNLMNSVAAAPSAAVAALPVSDTQTDRYCPSGKPRSLLARGSSHLVAISMVILPPREGQQAVRQRCRPAGRPLRDCHIFLQFRQEKCAFRRDRSIATATRSAMTAFGSKATAEISR
jgi:hypothetical protein